MTTIQRGSLIPVLDFTSADMGSELFLVKPILPVGGVALLHAKRNVGKTPMAIALMGAVASGSDFLGRFPTLQGRVVYIQADMGMRLQQERLRLALPRLRGMENAAVLNMDAFNILETDGSTPWVQQVQEFAPALIIVDTLRDSYWGISEQDNNTPPLVYGRWKALFPDTAVCFLHHDRKSPLGPNGKPLPPNEEAAAGAGAWIDKADLGIHLTKRKKTDKMVRVRWSKLRTCPPDLPEMSLMLDEKTVLFLPQLTYQEQQADSVVQVRLPEASLNKQADLLVEILDGSDHAIGLTKAKEMVREARKRMEEI